MEPRRLSELDGPEATLLRWAEDDRPAQGARERAVGQVCAALGAATAGAVMLGAATAAAKNTAATAAGGAAKAASSLTLLKAATSSVAAKVLLIGAAVTASAGAGYMATHSRGSNAQSTQVPSPGDRQRTSTPSGQTVASPATGRAAETRGESPSGGALSERSPNAPEGAAGPVVGAHSSAVAGARPRQPVTATHPPTAPSAAPGTAAPSAALSGGSASEGSAPASPAAPPPDSSAAPPVLRATGGLDAEILLLDRARQELRGGRPASAASLLDRYRASFANGRLSLEASVLHIEALLALGRRAEAESESRRLRATYPSDTLSRRLEQIEGSVPLVPEANP